ncbi:MAG: transporter substrate-binding domain-containing protein, partial [Kiritimatiellae bacterium]|nr:transporter substrate-binding domain-containing protein [Kiritimatiellia bacterium]
MLLILFVIMGGMVSAEAPGDDTREKVTIQFRWTHQFQFAGYYAAKAKGFYVAEGLDVAFKERKPSENIVNEVLADRAEYGVDDSGILLRRANGDPVVVLAQIFQHSPLVLLANKDSGIISPYEMVNKKVMYGVGDANLDSLFLETLGSLSAFERVPHSMNYNDFCEGRVDVMSAYLTDQPFHLRKMGVDFNLINPQSYGIDFYGDNLFTSERELREHPERVEKMIRATLRGWEYALEHPDEIIDLILQTYHPGASREHLEFEARMTRMMILPDLIPLGDINSGRFQNIAESYARLGLIERAVVPEGLIYHSPEEATIFLTEQEKAWLRNHPVLSLAVDDHYPPKNFVDQTTGELVGISIDYMRLISQKLGVSIRFEGSSWDQSLQKAMRHEVDGIVNADELEERKPYLDFTEVYARYPQAVLVRQNEEPIHSFDDLAGQTVAAKTLSSQLSILKKRYPNVEVMEIEDLQQGLELLISREVDGLFDDLAVLHYEVFKGFYPNLDIAFSVNEPPVGFSRIGVRNNDPMLLQVLNRAIASITEAEQQTIRKKWMLPLNLEEPESQLLLTETEKQWLKNHPVIRVASDQFWMPLEFLGPQGEFKGIAIDYLKRIEKKLGIRFEIEKGTHWQGLIEKAKRREVDLFTCVAKTPERSTYLSFTEPYISSPIVIFNRINEPFAGDLSGLSGKKAAVVKGYAIHEIIARNHPDIELGPATDIDAALDMVEEGRVSAYIGSLIVTSHQIAYNGHPLIKVAGETPYTLSLGMATRSDWPELTTILQKALNSISTKERNAIYKDWMSVTYEHRRDYSLIWKLVGGMILVVFVFIGYNRKLEAEVRKQTKALRLSETHYRLLANNTADVIWTMDDALNLTYVSPSIQQLRGYSAEETMRQTLEEQFAPESLEQVNQALAQTPHTESPLIFEGKQMCEDGTGVWVEISVHSMKDTDGRQMGLIGITRNINERKQAEQEKMDLEKQLHQTRKMEALGTLANGIAHDFNNILSAIYGYTEMVRTTLQENSPEAQMQDEIMKAASRAKDLVKQILLFSRQREITCEPIMPDTIVWEAYTLLRASIPAAIHMNQSIEKNCGLIMADSTQLHQIVLNLCTNAHQAMQEFGGVLTVQLSAVELKPEDLEHDLEELCPGPYIRLYVSDKVNGIS